MSDDWWVPFYDETIGDLLLERRDPDQVARTLAFLEDQLALEPNARVLDQCCGRGDLGLPLARRGYRVVGIDQCASYVELGRRTAQAEGLDVTFVEGDATGFDLRPEVDAAFNWYTSFGYSPDDRTNRKMIDAAARALVPGGRYALDFVNFARIIREFETVRLHRLTRPDGEVLVLRESRLDLAAGGMIQDWTRLEPDGARVRHRTFLRIYFPHQIKDMMQEAGLVDIALFGDLDGSALTTDSPRVLAVGRRPA